MAKRIVNERLGIILLSQDLVSEEQLKTALETQAGLGDPNQPVGSAFVELGFVSEADLIQALGIQFNLPVMSLNDFPVDPKVLSLVSQNYVKRYTVFPVLLTGRELTLAVSDPSRVDVFDAIAAETGYRIRPVLAPSSEIREAIENLYPRREIKRVKTLKEKEPAPEHQVEEVGSAEVERLKIAGKETPIVGLIDHILEQAVSENASDIHIEPSEKNLLIRFRVDGILREFLTLGLNVHPSMVSRIKILSDLNIAERVRPQDGRIQAKIEKKDLDIRVSTVPTVFGEKVVMRLLDRRNAGLPLTDLGFSDSNFAIFRKLIDEPYGLILVTGPTGSGKSTTLYAALNTIRSMEVNVVTVEDPVEYQLSLVNQIQVNPAKEVTFSNALRYILRQDPDVIMVGEIRDPETGNIATEAALTGHLVLSTLHTNDAAATIIRLVDMGVDPFLLAPALLGVLAQRLVRKICDHCKEFYTPTPVEVERLGLQQLDDLQVARGKGCEQCKRTGYKGRTGIHEVLIIDERMRHLISMRASVSEIRAHAVQHGFTDMRFDGLRKVISGITTTEEILMATRS